MKILIIRLSSMGDIVFTTSIIEFFNKNVSNSKIHFLVKDKFKDLIYYNPYLDKKIIYNSKKSNLLKLFKILKNENYDLIYDAHNNLRSNLLVFLFFVFKTFNKSLRKTKIIQFKKERIKRFFLIYFKINLFKKFKLPHEKFIEPLFKLNLKFDSSNIFTPKIFIPKEYKEKYNKLLLSSFNDKKKIIAIGPGAAWPGKIWKYYEELIFELKKDYNLVLVGDKKDILFNKLVDNKSVISFIAKTSILESISIINNSDLFVSNDTGLVHAAEAIGVDVVCIMGPTSKEFAYPHRNGSIVIEQNLWCRPCSKNGASFCYNLTNRKCLKDINTMKIVSKVNEKLL